MKMVNLTQGYVAIVDPDSAVDVYRWKILKANGKLYAVRTNGRTGKAILMHREITGAPKGKVVDHINGNGLDNRRCNLRVGTQSNNLSNTTKVRGKSKFKGVYWNKEKGLWQAAIGDGVSPAGRQKRRYLGRFDNEKAAALAYDKAAYAKHGPFARMNFPDQVTP